MIFGMDYLGGAKYGDAILKAHPKGWAAGFFANAFGDALPVVKELAKAGNCPLIRVQIVWSDTHDYGDKDIALLKKEVRRYEALARSFPSVVFELSPFCEHNLALPDKYLGVVEREAPTCRPVNSVWKGALSKKYKNEVHGTKASKPRPQYNFSYDGNSATGSDVESIKRNLSDSDVFFFWEARFNGKKDDNDKTPRPDRTLWPDVDFIRSIAFLATPKGKTSLPKATLFKTHSEKKDRPVVITPLKTQKILLKVGGVTVDELPRYPEPYVDGRHRYYSSTWGYKTMQKYGHCEVFADGLRLGVVNPGFRENDYR